MNTSDIIILFIFYLLFYFTLSQYYKHKVFNIWCLFFKKKHFNTREYYTNRYKKISDLISGCVSTLLKSHQLGWALSRGRGEPVIVGTIMHMNCCSFVCPGGPASRRAPEHTDHRAAAAGDAAASRATCAYASHQSTLRWALPAHTLTLQSQLTTNWRSIESSLFAPLTEFFVHKTLDDYQTWSWKTRQSYTNK